MTTRVAEIITADFWPLLRDRLKDPSVTNPLGPATDVNAQTGRQTRVYLPDDVYAEVNHAILWGRVSIVPIDPGHNFETEASSHRRLMWMALVEFTMVQEAGIDRRATMGAIHRAIARRYVGWRPELARALLMDSITLLRPAQDQPIRDTVAKLWYSSADYTVLVAPKPV